MKIHVRMSKYKHKHLNNVIATHLRFLLQLAKEKIALYSYINNYMLMQQLNHIPH